MGTTRRRLAIASGLAFVGLCVYAWYRGSVPEQTWREPASADERVRCQLVESPVGTPVRCVAFVDLPAAPLVEAVRDYESFPEIFDGPWGSVALTSIQSKPPDRVHLDGRVEVLGVHWPIDMHIDHETTDEGFVARWDAHDDHGRINRGRWVVTEKSETTALVAYELEVQSPWSPTFLVNDVLLTRMKDPLRRIIEHAHEQLDGA